MTLSMIKNPEILVGLDILISFNNEVTLDYKNGNFGFLNRIIQMTLTFFVFRPRFR